MDGREIHTCVIIGLKKKTCFIKDERCTVDSLACWSSWRSLSVDHLLRSVSVTLMYLFSAAGLKHTRKLASVVAAHFIVLNLLPPRCSSLASTNCWEGSFTLWFRMLLWSHQLQPSRPWKYRGSVVILLPWCKDFFLIFFEAENATHFI